MSTLSFKLRLQELLDEAKLPQEPRERSAAFATIFNIEPKDARNIVNNGKLPDNELLEKIAAEFEVTSNYLRGDSNSKTAK